MPAAGEYEARLRRGVVEYRLGRCRRVLVNPPWDQHGEHRVTPCDRLLDHLAVVRSAGNDCNAPFEGVELADAALAADANHVVTPVKRVLHHVLSELPG